MGLSETLGRIAAGAPVPVFPIAGHGAREAIQDLRLQPQLRLLDSPGPAAILLVAGTVPDSLATPLARVHDALAHPRATLHWAVDGQHLAGLPGFADPVVVHGDPVTAAVTTYRELVAGRRPSEPPILPDVDPAPWRGVGPYGQGGSGMTGGTPYGRPMAELGPDPDGLRLDILPLSVGPFFPRFPAGLILDVRLAGDLVLEAAVTEPLDEGADLPIRPGLRPFLRALSEPVPIAELELARAREHLRWLADALHAQGLPALGQRAVRVARAVTPGGGAALDALRRLVERSQVARWSIRGVGRIERDRLAGLGAGPVARACGLREDVRLEDPGYRSIGFEPLVGEAGDAPARWRLRLAEAAQSLELAARAGDRRSEVSGRVESPRGRLEAGSGPSDRLIALVPGLLREVEWGDAIASLASLDLDPEESALVRQVARREAVA